MIAQEYWRPNLYSKAKDHVKSCVYCALAKGTKRVKNLMQLTQKKEGDPIEYLAADHSDPYPPTKEGYKYILVIQCAVSRYREMTPLKSLGAIYTAKAIYKFILRYGTPRVLLKDNGTAFKNAVLRSLCDKFNIKKLFSTAYYPEGNAKIERQMRTLNTQIHRNDTGARRPAATGPGPGSGPWAGTWARRENQPNTASPC